MPFDVFIYCKNPTKKAINPQLSFYIRTEETPTQIGLWALKHLNYSEENKSEKLRDFLLNFNSELEKNKGKLPLNQKERNGHLADLIISGLFNKK